MSTDQFKTSLGSEHHGAIQLADRDKLWTITGECFGMSIPGTQRTIYNALAFGGAPRLRLSLTASAGTVATVYL